MGELLEFPACAESDGTHCSLEAGRAAISEIRGAQGATQVQTDGSERADRDGRACPTRTSGRRHQRLVVNDKKGLTGHASRTTPVARN